MDGQLPTISTDYGQYLVAPLRHAGGGNGGTRRGPRRKKAPSYRHGTPSGPWPFLDIEDEVDPKRIIDPDNHLPLSAEACSHRNFNGPYNFCWCKYPQALYPNWTRRQQKKSKINKIIEKSNKTSRVYYVDVRKDAVFTSAGPPRVLDQRDVSSLDEFWRLMNDKRPTDSRARVVFLDTLNGPSLQMFGTRYNIEPFFFSSTIGAIPSRFQSNVIAGEEDHVTLTLSFIRSIPNIEEEHDFTSAHSSQVSLFSQLTSRTTAKKPQPPKPKLKIDTQAPLALNSPAKNLLLTYDFLSVHMVRRKNDSTLISCHSGDDDLTTDAQTMFERFLLCGQSVYWSSIFQSTQDPTFLLLCILWYVMYAWDEAFDALYEHICYLESKVMTANDLEFTEELHIVRAHLLHYESLMDEFRKTVEFVAKVDAPALDNDSAEDKKITKSLITRECENLLRDIKRLERNRMMQDRRLKNVMDLSFNIINIEDSKRMAKLTEAAVRDSAAMKQIAYLTMVFLPAGFVATCFGMNITEINPAEAHPSMTLAKYLAVAFPLTAVTIWLVIAYQIQLEDPRQPDVEENVFTDAARQLGSKNPGQPKDSTEQAPTGIFSPGGTAHAPTSAPYYSRWTLDPKPNSRRKRMGFVTRLLWPVWLFMSIFTRKQMVEATVIKSSNKKPMTFSLKNQI